MYLVAIIVSFIFLRFFYRKKFDRTPAMLFFLVWFVTLSAQILMKSLVNFEVLETFSVDLFIASSLAAFGVGYHFFNTKYPLQRSQIKDPIKILRLQKYCKLIALIGISACLGLMLRKLSISGINFNLEEIRKEVFDQIQNPSSNKPDIIIYLATNFLPFSALSIIALPYLSKTTGLKVGFITQYKHLVAINIILISLIGFLIFGGRMTIVIVILSYYISKFFMSDKVAFRINWKHFFSKKIILGFIFIVVAYWMSTSFLELREGEITDVNNLMMLLMRMTPSSYVQNIIDNNQSLGLLLLSLGYFTANIPSLDYYFQVGNIPGPYMGGYNFPLPSLIFSKIFPVSDNYSWSIVREQVFSPFVTNQYAGNVWATWLRDLTVDFTQVGCIVFMFIYGAIVASMFRRGNNGNIFAYCIAVLMTLVLVFSPLTGLLSGLIVTNGIIFSITFWLFSRIFSK